MSKMFSRRDFIHAGCSAWIVTLAASPFDKAKAWTHGAAVNNNNRVTLNVQGGIGTMNLAKAWFPNFPNPIPPSQIDANGYPSGTLSAGSLASISLAANYYGQYNHSWSGTGLMQYVGQPAIIYNGGTFCGLGGNTGTVQSNLTISGTAANVAFKFGALVTAVSGGGGSLVTITTTSVAFGSGFPTGSTITLGTGVSSNLSNGPNKDGSWTITNVSGTQFTLDGSTGVTSPTVTGAGGVGTQSEAILGMAAASLSYGGGSTYTSFTNLVICVSAFVTPIANGQYWDPTIIAQFQSLKGTPGGVGRAGDFWLRFMDISGVIGSYECDFSQRCIPASQFWGGGAIAAYQAGAITNGGAGGAFTDVYTCASNPSNSPASGPPIDCEIIQGVCSATNSGGMPGLTVSGRTGFGTWPIITDGGAYAIIASSAPASAGLTLHFTFQASWLNGGVSYVFSYVTVLSDVGSVSNFNSNLTTALVADLVLQAGKIVFTNSGGVGVITPTFLSGTMSLAYTLGPAILIVETLAPSSIATTGVQTFFFNALMQGFVYVPGFVRSYPFEVIVDLCNRVGANCWYNWPIYTKGAFITSVTNFFGDAVTGLTSGLKFGAEVGNEMWNFTSPLWGRAQSYGIALGCFSYPYGSNDGPYSWTGLRTIQYAALSRAAWAAKGRAANQHYILTMSQTADVFVSGNFDRNTLQGVFLTTVSNTNFANYAGIGGTASGSYTAAGSRPVDITNAIGCAPYWGSPWWGGDETLNPITGTVAQNAPWLQAALDYSNGLTTTAFGELTNQFNGTVQRSGGSDVGLSLATYYGNVTGGPNTHVFANEEAQAAQYDNSVSAGVRYNSLPNLAILHYEGGPQWAMGNNLNSGINTPSSKATDVSSIAGGDVTALANQMSALGWDVSPYTGGAPPGNYTTMATWTIQLAQGWKYDTDLNGNAANTGSYKNLIKSSYYQALSNISAANREVHGAQYGYAASQWGLWWSAFNAAGNPYQSYNAFQEFNA